MEIRRRPRTSSGDGSRNMISLPTTSSCSVLLCFLVSSLLATASSSSHNNQGGYYRRPPPGHGSSRDERYGDGDPRDRYNGRRSRDWDSDSTKDGWDNRPPMPSDPPPPPPQEDTGGFGIMGGYGQSTPLPGATPPMAAADQPGIHYNFPSAETVDKKHEREEKRRGADAANEEEYGFVPQTNLPPPPQQQRQQRPMPPHRRGRDGGPEWTDPQVRGRRNTATARKDAVQTYISNHKLGRFHIMSSSALFGYGVGAFLGQSVTNSAQPLANVFAALFCMLTILRNHYGELSKALGLGLIMTVGRLGKVRKQYPTGPHLKAILNMGQREPFPPVYSSRENVWRYKVREGYEDIDPDFNMMQTVAAMVFIGGFCGGNFPLVPTWLGGTAGAAALALGTTLRGPKGDLYRTMGMRVVSLVEEMMDVVGELGLARKGGYTASKIFDRMMFLDRKHGIRKKIGAGISFIVERVSRTANEVKADMDEDDDYSYERYRDDQRRY